MVHLLVFQSKKILFTGRLRPNLCKRVYQNVSKFIYVLVYQVSPGVHLRFIY